MPSATPFITNSNAVALAKLSWERRRAKKAAALAMPQPVQRCAASEQPAALSPDLVKLTRAMSLIVDKLCNTDIAFKERQALARSYRDLREVWHMVTGEPKPGNRKPGPDRKRHDKPTGQTATVTIAPAPPPAPPVNPG